MSLDKFRYFGVHSINSRDANGWKDMMSISKEIIKKLKFIKKMILLLSQLAYRLEERA